MNDNILYGFINEISIAGYSEEDYDQCSEKFLNYLKVKVRTSYYIREAVFIVAYLKEEYFLKNKNIFKIGSVIKIIKNEEDGIFYAEYIDEVKEWVELIQLASGYSEEKEDCSFKDSFYSNYPDEEYMDDCENYPDEGFLDKNYLRDFYQEEDELIKKKSSSDVFEEKITKIISNDIISYVSNNIFNTSILNDSPMGYILLMDTINEYEDIALEDIIKHYYYQISDFKAKMIFLKASTIAKDYYWKPKDAIPPKVKTKSIINTNGYYTASFTKYIEKLQANYEFHYTFLFNDFGLVWCIPHDISPYHPSEDEINDFMLYTDYDEFSQITKYEISGYSIEAKYFLSEDEESIKSDIINPSFFDCWRGTINQNILVLSYYKSVLNPYTNKYVEIPTFSNIKFNFHEITN